MSLDETMKEELEEILVVIGTEKFDANTRARLNAIVSESDEARRIYIDHCQMQAMLRDSSLLATFSTDEMPPEDSVVTPSFQWSAARRAGLAAAACVMFLIGATATQLVSGVGGSQSSSVIATVTEIDGDARLGKRSLEVGQEIKRGTLRMSSGSVALRFSHGSKLLVEGNSKMSFDSSMQVSLKKGKVAARVSEAGYGFTILGPNTAVVDLGTEFAMAVDGGRGWVEVYDGEVDIALLNQDGHAWKSRLLTPTGPVLIDSSEGQIVAQAPPLSLPRFPAASLKKLKVSEAYVQAVFQDAPAHYWRFGANAGEAEVDLVGNADAVIEGGVKHFAGGLYFVPGEEHDGSVFIEAPDQSLFHGEFSMEFWFNPALVQKRTMIKIDQRDSSGNYLKNLYRIVLESSQQRMYPKQSVRFTTNLEPFGENANASVYSPAPYAIETWQHVVAVRHEDRFAIYLNGALSQSAPLPGILSDPVPTSITFGRSAGPHESDIRRSTNYYKGQLDEVAIYPRPLTKDEVVERYTLMQEQQQR